MLLKICARLAAVSASPFCGGEGEGSHEGVPVEEGAAVGEGASGEGEGTTVGGGVGVVCDGGVLVGCGVTLGDGDGVIGSRVWILTRTSSVPNGAVL
jgi:hypothetical protein